MIQEVKFRDLLTKGLPKLAQAALAGVYPMAFNPVIEPAREFRVDSQIVCSQLAYTKNLQVLTFLIIEPGQIMKLGKRAFPKCNRAEASKMVISANGEALNTVMAKLGYLLGKLDEDAPVTIAPPMVINCSSENGIRIQESAAFILGLSGHDSSMVLVASIQQV